MKIEMGTGLKIAPIKLFSGTSNPGLAEEIAERVGQPLGKLEVGHFQDGETVVNVGELVRGYDIFLIQSTCTPVNDHLMEALILIDAFKRASAGRINWVLPYYGYARQDRKTKGRDPITAKLVANLITVAGADRVVTMDLHAGQIQGYFDIPVDHLKAAGLIANYFRKKNLHPEETVVVSPDLGGVSRARAFAERLNLPIAIIEKIRPRPNESKVMNIIGDIEGKHAIIIDDIIDTAGTITNAAAAVKEHGAKDVYIAATHGVLSGEAVDRIENSVVEECIITNTIPFKGSTEDSKIKVVSVAKIFAEAILAINMNNSISQILNKLDKQC